MRGWLLLSFLGSAILYGAEVTSVHSGPFTVLSASGAKDAQTAAADLEQLRYGVGKLLGKDDLRLGAPIMLFLNAAPAGADPSRLTRTGALPLWAPSGFVDLVTREQIAGSLLDNFPSALPLPWKRGLATFLSTAEVRGAHVTWGAPPVANRKTPEWARVASLVTDPDTYSNVRVLLGNLAAGMDEDTAYRNALHRSREDVERAAAAYLAGPGTRRIDAPSRPLNPQRDLPARSLNADEVALLQADLLDNRSAAAYRAMIAAGKHTVEAREGLGLMAYEAHEAAAALDLLRRAVDDGSRNARALVVYAGLEPDHEKARAVLERAVAADPENAEAHFALAGTISDSTHKLAQLELAVKSAPQKPKYNEALANALADAKRWSEAAHAYRRAELATSDSDERERMRAARLALDEQRLDYENAEKRRAREAEERETARLKGQAIASIRAAEAKVNGGADGSADARDAVPWDQLQAGENKAGTKSAQGRVVEVVCSGKRKRVTLRTASGETLLLNAANAGDTLPCGAHAGQDVSVTYKPVEAKPAAKDRAIAGDIVSVAVANGGK